MEDAVAGSASPPTLLSLFWDLASLDKGARLDAAEKLVRALDFEPVEPDSDVEMDDADGSQQLIDAALSTDTAYSLKRLVRGLPSSRLGARQGFSVALTELLSRLSGVPLAAILDLLEKHTVVTGSAKGSEEKEMLLGRLFGLAAVVHSGYLARDSTESEDILRLANTLVTLSASKSYLAEPAFAVLGSMIPDIAKRPDAESLASELAKAALDPLDTFDALALALALQSAFPNLDWQELLPEWKKGDLLRSENLEKLAAPCLESSKAHPRVHSGWKVLLEALVGGGKKKIGIKEFWDGVVECGSLGFIFSVRCH